MSNPFVIAAIIVFATTCLTVTSTKAKIFAPARDFVAARSKFFGEMVRCPYCTCHWWVILLGLIYRPRLLSSGIEILDIAVSILAIIGFSTLVIGLVIWLFGGSNNHAALPKKEDILPAK